MICWRFTGDLMEHHGGLVALHSHGDLTFKTLVG